MAKSKQQDESTRKSGKKLKKLKAPKSPKPSKDSGSENCTSLLRKQTELARVFSIKCAQLLQGNLSYLEYMELRDEICRLNGLKEIFEKKASVLEKL